MGFSSPINLSHYWERCFKQDTQGDHRQLMGDERHPPLDLLCYYY